jgi:hypothetical protein
MVGGSGGESEPVAWVQGARLAAAKDLVAQLRRQPLVREVVVVTPEKGSFGAEVGHLEWVQSEPGPLHVGRHLSELVAERGISRLFYCGGGAAPLLSDEELGDVLEKLAARDGLVITNNQFASDWAGVAPAEILGSWVTRLPRDNMLGWVLSAEAGLTVEALPAQASTRLDIDTPSDLIALSLHAGTKPQLRRYLRGLPLPLEKARAVLDVLATPATQVTIAGRVGPEAWHAINKETRCWLRVIAEERGMVSSGRQMRGEVRSLLAAYIEAVGMKTFFADLAEWGQAALLDTRVLLAHNGRWPGAVDRFNSDLGRAEAVEDPWLRSLTVAALNTPIPIILGGHGLMSGTLWAFSDLLRMRGREQP